MPARYKGAWGGRGSGKSHFFAECIIERCVVDPASRIVCIREIQRSLKESVKRLVEDKIQAFDVGRYFRVLNDQIATRHGGVILFQGMQDHTAESIKSLEGFNVAYVEEAQTMTARSLEMLRPTMRSNSELWFSWNPRSAEDPVDDLLRGANPPPDSVVVRTSYADIKFFPSELEQERQFDFENSPDRYGHIWEGDYEPQAVGAIWNRQNLHRNRASVAPPLGRIVVAIDPPGTALNTGSEAGIVAAAIGADGRGYVLGDESDHLEPKDWAEKACALYDLLEADAIVAETNHGGDMVKATIRSVRPSVRVIEVRASRAKHVRAEPISSLYSLNRVSHVGAYPELEAQMCLMTDAGFQGTGSPDRVDALVWAFSELFPKLTKRQVPKGQQLPQRANSMYNPHRMGARH